MIEPHNWAMGRLNRRFYTRRFHSGTKSDISDPFLPLYSQFSQSFQITCAHYQSPFKIDFLKASNRCVGFDFGAVNTHGNDFEYSQLLCQFQNV